ncbi:hypothetical protein BX616_005774 [Lobosporangium transversale]|nr:hypothetical protein BX616_005774 [Lobosporangium transversale]
MKQVGFLDGKGQKELTGYDMLAFSRPKLYDLMRKQVPVEKISMNKKVIRIEEVPSEDKIRIYCVDNSHYEGHILVGADGAYSGVRKSLYKQLDEKGVLPKEDLDNFKMAYVNLVGVADFKDRGNDQTNEKYPQLKDNFGTFAQILGHDNRSWGVRNVADKQICWSLSAQVAEPESQGLNINNAEWGPEANEAMIKQFENEPCPWGGKMGDLIEATPKNLISKVVLEDKLFKTWYHGRTVLIGDAAHKMLPGGAQGAINAMQDAVVLANSIFALTDLSFKNITAAFETYYHQRYSRAGGHVKRSSVMSQLMAGQTWTDRTIRHVMFNYIPEWIHQWSLSKTAEYRPQLAWLPLAPDRGKGNVSPQECVRKELEETAQAI